MKEFNIKTLYACPTCYFHIENSQPPVHTCKSTLPISLRASGTHTELKSVIYLDKLIQIINRDCRSKKVTARWKITFL